MLSQSQLPIFWLLSHQLGQCQNILSPSPGIVVWWIKCLRPHQRLARASTLNCPYMASACLIIDQFTTNARPITNREYSFAILAVHSTHVFASCSLGHRAFIFTFSSIQIANTHCTARTHTHTHTHTLIQFIFSHTPRPYPRSKICSQRKKTPTTSTISEFFRISR